ncbi:hypothetical protein [Blastococcus sp. TF02A-35]|uniref:hypothetical protein n=1 Tax=Blastococcus sp. TF02A-35 TaxID=2559612 RepID=UPI001073AEEA|nr:hypothetical protein [Blastococcus sp. TF02A_35]TFV52092.1 hypothetical protein E4P43_07570 [Blastococcus sp. TF02A_35]
MTSSGDHGGAAETAVRDVAAALGLPDFVYIVPRVRKGKADREVGDALLIANGAGAVVQVKARRPDAMDDGSGWLTKHGRKASRQAEGSRRTIEEQQRSGKPLTAFPVRVTNLDEAERQQAGLLLDHDVSSWPTIIVVDHPGVTGQPVPDPSAFWITLDDWHQLMRGLRSVTALLKYVRRVLAAEPPLHVPLGQEQQRFLAVIEADARAGGTAGWLTSEVYTDPVGAQLYRELVERVWPNDQSLPAVTLSNYRRVVDFLDATPPGAMPRLGRWLLAKRAQQAEHNGHASGLVILDQAWVLIFAAATWTEPSDESIFDAVLAALAIVRSAEISTFQGYPVSALAVGHLVAENQHIDYRYVLPEGPVEPTQRERSLVLHNFGLFDGTQRTVVPLIAGPQERCPCGSGLLFRECEQSVPSW